MNYDKQTQTAFEQTLKYFEALESKNSITTIEATQLCLLCRKFEDLLERWVSCSKTSGENAKAAANAYQVYVKSTPLYELLNESHGKRFSWIMQCLDNKTQNDVEQ